jgi:hypothetical protein
MFSFKVQLFQGCKSETEPINTKSVMQHIIRYQVLLAAYYKVDTKYCCCRATCLSGYIVDFTTHTSTVCIRYQVLLATYYKADTSIVAVVQRVCQVTLSTSLHTHQPFVYDTKYCCCRATSMSGYIVDFTTHTSTVCIRYQVLLAAYYKADTSIVAVVQRVC